jgi:transcriptional regulator ATRX
LQVLVFSQSLLSLDLIETFLKLENDRQLKNADNLEPGRYGTWLNGQDYYRMDGSTAPEIRKKWCNYFNKVTAGI